LIPRHELWNYLEGRTGVGRPPGSAKGQAVRHQTIRFPARAPATVGKIVIVEHDADPAPLKRAAKRATGGGRRKVKP
jgi:hypothetical protein